MTMILNGQMNGLIAKVDAVKDELLHAKCETAAKLLAMASLELQLQKHAISDREFKEYCTSLTRTTCRGGRSRKAVSSKGSATSSRVIKLNFSGQRRS